MNNKTGLFNAKIMCLLCLRDAEDVFVPSSSFYGQA